MQEIGGLEGSNGSEFIVYRLSHTQGKRFDELQGQLPAVLGADLMSRHRNLLDDLADFCATAWKTGFSHRRSSDPLVCDGKVGSSMLWRLRKLESKLPSRRLRSRAREARVGVEAGSLDQLPVVFTHGDLLPSNVLVDEQTWHINGMVDWAESEFLPFGLNLYGLEHLLGRLSSAPASKHSFIYTGEAECLRQYFWQQLLRRIPELEQQKLRQAVELARVVGTLLWHGFAWDDGRIDRVIDPARDAEELVYLEAFLDTGACLLVAHL